MKTQPTPDPQLNAVLHELVASVQHILADNLLGAYLQGSFALGDWDADSDVDFVVATQRDLADAELSALQALHARIYELPTHWGQHLEGSYIPGNVLRRPDPANTPPWFLNNTSRELVRSDHDDTLVVRWVVREHGITLSGPDPTALINPVDVDDLRREVASTMQSWAHTILADPDQMNNRWYQPFAVLSYCRMLYTLQTGEITSKPAAARWAQGALDREWAGLIERAWRERPDPSAKVHQPADPDDFEATLRFIAYALDARDRLLLAPPAAQRRP